MNDTVNILDIIRGTTVDGPGFRTSIYFAGCKHKCPGCHNPMSWNFTAGKPYSLGQILEIIEEEDFDVTLTGGDPLYQPEFTEILAKEIKKLNHSVWLYTGFRWEEVLKDSSFLPLLRYIDVIVDSPFIMELKDTDLLFRGSSNQRIIDVKKSLEGEIVQWHR